MLYPTNTIFLLDDFGEWAWISFLKVFWLVLKPDFLKPDAYVYIFIFTRDIR